MAGWYILVSDFRKIFETSRFSRLRDFREFEIRVRVRIVNAKGNYRMEKTQSTVRKETIRVPIKVCHDNVPGVNSTRKETIRWNYSMDGWMAGWMDGWMDGWMEYYASVTACH